MRHGRFGRRLSRSTPHRLAMRRNMVQSLIEHGEIRTTLVKAKEVRRLAERVIQLAVHASAALDAGDRIKAVGLRQRAIAMINDRQIIPAEHREEYDAMSDAKRDKVLRSRSGRRYRASTTRPGLKFTAESVIHRLFATVGPQMRERNESLGSSGGYTRIIKLADRRLGDGGQLAIIQLVSTEDDARAKGSGKTERARRAKLKYSFYAGKPLPRRGKSEAAAAADVSDAATAVAEAPADEVAEATDAAEPSAAEEATTDEPTASADSEAAPEAASDEDKKAD